MIFISRDLRQGSIKYASPIVTDARFHHVYITPEIRETAMQLLSKSRKAANGSLLGGMPNAHVVDEGISPVYLHDSDKEKAMKILTTLPVPENEMYLREVRKAEVYTGPSNTDYVPAREREKAMELHAKTEQDEYNKTPKLVNGANPQFLVVRYGWYAFAFLLEEGDVRGPELNAKAIQICEAMLTLESGGEDKELKYHTSYALQAANAFAKRDRQKRKAGRTTR